MRTLIALALITVAASATAQTVPDPTRLPGDAAPPPLERMLEPPHPRAPQPIEPVSGPTPALALEAAQVAIATCAAQGLHIGAAVTDSAGNLRVGLMGAGAAPGRIYTAVRKALAALAWRRPSSEIQALLRTHRSSVAALYKPAMVVVPGAVPLFAGGRLVGAIAASGATGDQDQACAMAGAARIHDRLQ